MPKLKTINNVYDEMIEASKQKEFLSTGFRNLDEFLDGGLMKKELIVLGGYTGSGKSFLAGQIFKNIASQGIKSAYISLEISNSMVVSRLLGQMSNIKPTRIMCGLLNPEENTLKQQAKAKLAPYEDFMIFTDDMYKLKDIENTLSSAPTSISDTEMPYEFIVVDFIQNVLTEEKDEYSAMTKVALEFQRMAKEYNCCIMVLSQLSNSAFKTNSLEYKGSGGIAQVADLGMFIIRNQDTPDKLTLQVKKNRRGISGVNFDFGFKFPGGLICEY
jgi:replicative DNA helicase